MSPSELTSAQEQITGLPRHRVDDLVGHPFQQFGDWQTQLRALAKQFEDLEARAKRAPDEEHGQV